MAKGGRPRVYYQFPSDAEGRREFLRSVIREMIAVLERESRQLDADGDAIEVARWIDEHAQPLARAAALTVGTTGIRLMMAAGHSAQALKPKLEAWARRYSDEEFVARLVRGTHNVLAAQHSRLSAALANAGLGKRDRDEVAALAARAGISAAIHEREARHALTLLRSHGAAAAADYVAGQVYGFSDRHVRQARITGIAEKPSLMFDTAAEIEWFPARGIPSAVAPRSHRPRRRR